MATLTFKVASADAGGRTTLRKLVLPHTPTSPLHFAALENAVRQRCGVAPGQVGLCYLDDEGDWIALSCEEELQDLLQSLDGTATRTVRLQLTIPAVVAPAETPQQSSGGEGESASADEWLDVGTPGDTNSMKGADADETPVGTPTLLFDFEDPAEAPLASDTASLADKTRALIEAEFPRRASTSAAAAATAEDPADEPIPSSGAAPPADDSPPAFTTLPASLSGLLSGLPSHANSFTAHLTSLLTSPDSALGRLSTALQNPSSTLAASDLPSLDLRDLGASLAAVGHDVTRAIGEVVDGVRREADGVRQEFDELRREFEREKRRFDDEVKAAMEQARAAQGVPASTASGAPSTAAAAAAPDLESSAARAARRALRAAKKQQKAARRLARAQRKLERRAKRDHDAELLARAQDDLLRASHESIGDARDGRDGVEMRGMPGGMPASFAASVQQPFASTSASAYNPAYPVSPAASSSSSTSTTSTTSTSSDDDDKPILLTKFLLAAAELGFDVTEQATRIALTDVWCESNGRGLSRMVEKACDELL